MRCKRRQECSKERQFLIMFFRRPLSPAFTPSSNEHETSTGLVVASTSLRLRSGQRNLAPLAPKLESFCTMATYATVEYARASMESDSDQMRSFTLSAISRVLHGASVLAPLFRTSTEPFKPFLIHESSPTSSLQWIPLTIPIRAVKGGDPVGQYGAGIDMYRMTRHG